MLSWSCPKFNTGQQSKVGIRNLSPHLSNSAILRTTKLVAELRTKKSCRTAIANPQNLTSAIPQLSAVSCQSLLSGTFSSAQDGFKNQLKIFFKLSVSLRKNQNALKGQLHEIFTSNFFHELT
jgi:hypothetical protein